MIIIFFFVAHWFTSLFFQTFFLHRYASHRMFTTSRAWERVFYIMTLVFQGSSFLNPRAYALMHREHHAYSDTEQDPHSPHFVRDVFQLMMMTLRTFKDHEQRLKAPEARFGGHYPEWPVIDRIGSSIASRLFFGVLYTVFYIVFATEWWMFLLLPVHYLMGPIHGAIVNWCGHKYGYANFDNNDKSKNTSPFDFLMLGELFQNNHHRYPNSANFGKRWFEIDPVYPVMKSLHYLGIIRLRKAI
ncbi:acyl-CoA desaturase [Pedobacter deserti]|uniref:acyl-CoA desaturase n=1 Tax=Pedobacter deserti TaxID=2817382 RepID=UPI00210870A9|nr:acyl-CoA desaturase [Pedobacter sp. SYSU D00382]